MPRPQAIADADHLIQHLARVAVHQPERMSLAGCVFQRVVDGIGGEDAGQNRAQRAARAMDAEGIQRIVVTELLFDRA